MRESLDIRSVLDDKPAAPVNGHGRNGSVSFDKPAAAPAAATAGAPLTPGERPRSTPTRPDPSPVGRRPWRRSPGPFAPRRTARLSGPRRVRRYCADCSRCAVRHFRSRPGPSRSAGVPRCATIGAHHGRQTSLRRPRGWTRRVRRWERPRPADPWSADRPARRTRWFRTCPRTSPGTAWTRAGPAAASCCRAASAARAPAPTAPSTTAAWATARSRPASTSRATCASSRWPSPSPAGTAGAAPTTPAPWRPPPPPPRPGWPAPACWPRPGRASWTAHCARTGWTSSPPSPGTSPTTWTAPAGPPSASR